MKPISGILVPMLVAALMPAACVTINVYFPEAAAREAANEFIGGVLGESAPAAAEHEPEGDAPPVDDGTAMAEPGLFDWLIPAAQAQQNIDIDINTPAIRATQQRMRERQQNVLRPYYEAGAIGFGNDGLVKVRDRSAVSLAERNRMQQAVNADNADRNAVYREIAVVNGHPEWEDEIRAIFAERWIALAPEGWYYQDAGGNWRQK